MRAVEASPDWSNRKERSEVGTPTLNLCRPLYSAHMTYKFPLSWAELYVQTWAGAMETLDCSPKFHLPFWKPRDLPFRKNSCF